MRSEDRVTALCMVDPPQDEPVESEAARDWWAAKHIAMISLARDIQSELSVCQTRSAEQVTKIAELEREVISLRGWKELHDAQKTMREIAERELAELKARQS